MSNGLKRYMEWMSRGRKTGRVAYVLKERDLPELKNWRRMADRHRLQHRGGFVTRSKPQGEGAGKKTEVFPSMVTPQTEIEKRYPAFHWPFETPQMFA